ncbi:hypothetical protein HPB51_001988 [Rhipicephalus microplus]|uniref:Uncharacterized protein n=1 Tax=Rhipicephalus microplus TaxID=6941 RepID=A0A9J6EWI3_RHIMP|nr:hypothetical protein HPB51_001988 [Rhipicephalus microplus]
MANDHVGFTTIVQASRTDCASASPDEDLDEGALDGESGGSAVPLSLTNAWGELRAIDIDIPDELTVDAFVRTDDDVVVYEEVTDEVIIESVREADDTEDQEEMHAKKPSPRVVLDALNTLRSFFGAHNDDVATFSSGPLFPVRRESFEVVAWQGSANFLDHTVAVSTSFQRKWHAYLSRPLGLRHKLINRNVLGTTGFHLTQQIWIPSGATGQLHGPRQNLVDAISIGIDACVDYKRAAFAGGAVWARRLCTNADR